MFIVSLCFVMIRLISRIDVRNGYHIKTVKCEGVEKLRPINSSLQLFSCGPNEYDEIVLIDSVASLYGFDNWLLREAKHYYCPIPLCVGGAIDTLDKAKATLDIGADKLIVNTAAISNPQLLEDISGSCGRQAVVLQVDSKMYNKSFYCATHSSRELTNLQVKDWLSMAYDLGAGEIHLTSIDTEGTNNRFPDQLADIAFLHFFAIILSGGIRNSSDILYFNSKFSATSFSLSSIPNIKCLDSYSLRSELSACHY